jgi:predicted NBD/HSP70 family sugar kinase
LSQLIRDASTLRDANLSMAFEAIWTADGMTRAELSRRLGMSRSTSSSLVQELIDYGLVREDGPAASTSGRRAITLRPNNQTWFVLGVDIGASHVSTLLMSLSGEVVSTRRERVDARNKPDLALDAVCGQAKDMMTASRLTAGQILGMGVAIPAPVEHGTNSRICEETMAAWVGLDVEESLGKRLGIRCIIDNDANLGALAEHWWGVGRQVRNMIYLKLATGVGCGVIIDGQLHRGQTGFCGEVGHMLLGDPNGDGRRSFNDLVGRNQLAARYEELSSQDEGSARIVIKSNQTLAQKAQEGEKNAKTVIEEAGNWVGVAVANVIHLLNPELIVLGGSLAACGDLLLKPVQETVGRLGGWIKLRETRVTLGRLGERDVATGAATIVVQAVQSDITGWMSRINEASEIERAKA